MKSEKQRILIVEDDAIIAEDLKDILESEGYSVIGIAATAARAQVLLDFTKPHIVLLDITLKGNCSGIELAKIINQKHKIPFIYITSYSDDQTLDAAINTFPAGYIVKPFSARDIIPVVKLTLSNCHAKTETHYSVLNEINKNIDLHLTNQEYRTLCLIAEAKTNAEIADTLSISINTVKSHIKRIYSKLNVNSKVAAVNVIMEAYSKM